MGPSQPDISVVVATRNRASRLARLLDSLRCQSLEAGAFEVIVVDDASSDATRELLERDAGSAELTLRVLHNEQPLGPGASRNLGWRQARGRLVGFIDDDCEADPQWLQSAAVVWAARSDAFVQGATDPNPAEQSRTGPFSYTIEVDRLGPHYETCNIFYPRELLERLDGFDAEAFPGGGEDTDLGWRAIEADASPIFAPQARARHAIHRLGPIGQLRRAAHWTATMRVFARHPGLRRAYLHNGLFWQVTHQMLVRVLIAAVLPRRWNALRCLLVAPYLIHARQRARKDNASIVILPYYLVHDLIEMAAVVRGAIRYRTPVL